MAPVPHYRLECDGCGRWMPDDGLMLACPRCGEGTLLRTRYRGADFPVDRAGEGIYRYRRWLPVQRDVPGSSRPAVYRSTGMGRALGLTDLWVSFSGFWPERGVTMRSGSFKELEAFCVLGRLPVGAGVLVVASAGNTACAFAQVSGAAGVPCVVVVPDAVVDRVVAAGPVGGQVRVVALEGGSYNDAIEVSRRIVASAPEFVAEGGVRNVARRDGLAVVLLAAFEAMGRLPEFYFQAVGSGAGAIAVFEAVGRLRVGASDWTMPRFRVGQNQEFAPLYRAWREDQSGEPVESDGQGERSVYANELVNRTPPFAVGGGMRTVLRATDGQVLLADGAAARAARAMFEELEGIDIEPPAAVAVACLVAQVRRGEVPPGASVLLNITGGGRARLARVAPTGAVGRPEVLSVGLDNAPEVVGAKVLSTLTLG